MIPAIITAHILIFQGDSILLVRHNESAGHVTGTYGIPGGHVEENESLKQAAVGEFEEETGLIVQENELSSFPRSEYTADIKRKDGTTKRYTMHIFLAQKFEGDLKSDYETTPEWINLDSLDSVNLLPNVKNAILAAQDFLQEGYVNEG